ncbi:aldo/keto reductase [Leptospira interrogans]
MIGTKRAACGWARRHGDWSRNRSSRWIVCARQRRGCGGTIERAWSLGVRFFDTAPLYGFGLGERRLGGFLRQQGLDSFAISTKVGRLLRSTTALRKTVITREHPPSGRNSTSATTV